MKVLWQKTWRIGLCALLLLWIVHSIFVNEARQQHGAETFAQLPRAEQGRQGWTIGPSQLARTLGTVRRFHFSALAATYAPSWVPTAWPCTVEVRKWYPAYSREREFSVAACPKLV